MKNRRMNESFRSLFILNRNFTVAAHGELFLFVFTLHASTDLEYRVLLKVVQIF
jgi:hypothetical protein